MRSQPFARARGMMAAIQAIMSSTFGLQQQEALQALGGYSSRGHGRGKDGRNFMRRANRSKYKPHQGRQECARRAARGR